MNARAAVGLWLLSLAVPLAAQATVGAHYAAGDVAVWAIEQEGARVGTSATRCLGSTELAGRPTFRFEDAVSLELGKAPKQVQMLLSVERWVDAQGRPLRFELRSQLGDARGSVEGSFAAGKLDAIVHQGTRDQNVSVPVATDGYLLANNALGTLELVLALEAEPEQHAHTLISANVLQQFPYTLRLLEPSADGERRYLDSLNETLVVSAQRKLVRVELTAQKTVLRRVDEPWAPVVIERPVRTAAADFEREDVEIADGPVVLAGTVTRPKGAHGKLPALTFLSGSGGQDRDGYASGLDLGTHEILDRLTRDGFLVLRFDDRGVGASRGPTDGMAFPDIVEDGRRALKYLAARPDVDPERIALIGHSEGGLSGPLLATQERVAALVLMAAPGRVLEDVLREQLLAARREAGAQAEELDAFEKTYASFVDAIAKDASVDVAKLPLELAQFVPARAWLKSHVGRDPLATIARVRCPILVLQGGKDVQVSAERDAPKLRAALDAAGHADHELRVFAGLDHLFKLAGDPPSGLDYLRARPVDAEFLDVLSTWLSARLAPK